MIVQKFGGQIKFKSKYRIGSEFMFSFEIDECLGSPVVRSSLELRRNSDRSSVPKERRNSNISDIKIFNNVDIAPVARNT